MYFWDEHRGITRYYEILMSSVCEKYQLRQMEYDILMFLYNNPQHNTAADIVRYRKSTKSHVSTSLKVLEEKGLIERRIDKDNKKRVEIYILDSADDIIKDGISVQQQFAKDMLNGLTADEIILCKQIFKKIYNNAEECIKAANKNGEKWRKHMSKIEEFVKLMTGHFDNKEQFEAMKEAGKIYPYAKHVNTICNDKIKNIPVDFKGIFIVEESYYETNKNKHASPHLFLITEEQDGILLSSYEIPNGENKSTFSYDSMQPVEYSELKKSEKFTPALYHEKDHVWEGGSTSQFTPVMKFKLWERFSEECLEVSESMEINGKRTFGYDDPIIYKRCK